MALGASGLVQYAPVGARSEADGLSHGLVPVSHVTLLQSPAESFSTAGTAMGENANQGTKRRFSSEPYPNNLSYPVLKRARQQYLMADVNGVLAPDVWGSGKMASAPAYGKVGSGFNELDILSSAAVLVGNPAQKLVQTAPSQPAMVAQPY